MDLSSAFAGKRVLVTGHTGFKGSWLALWLVDLGAEVLGYALAPERPDDHFCLLKLDRLLHHVEGDLRNADRLQRACREFRPEVVFHLAAQALVRRSYDDPKLTFDTNVGGSVNLLEMVRSTPSVRALVYVTSDKCYRNKEWIWGYRENDELGGHDPYSASKAAAEIVFAGYRDSFFADRPALGAASARAGNVIGGGDWAPDRIVPDCVRALRDGQVIRVRNPDSTRPWQHVLDPLAGYLALAVRLAEDPARYSGSWNFGPDGSSVRTVAQIVDGITRRWGGGRVVFDSPHEGRAEARLLQLNIDKARHHLGWCPRWNFGQALDRTVDWYRAVLAGEPAIDVSRAQIRGFQAEAA